MKRSREAKESLWRCLSFSNVLVQDYIFVGPFALNYVALTSFSFGLTHTKKLNAYNDPIAPSKL